MNAVDFPKKKTGKEKKKKKNKRKTVEQKPFAAFMFYELWDKLFRNVKPIR